MKITYQGKLAYTSNGEEDEILTIDGFDVPLANLIYYDIKKHGNNLTVKYWISDIQLTKEELLEEFLLQLCGLGEATYNVMYSEPTGYLWTTENLIVGGHDLLQELKSNIGKWLYMEIDYDG